MQITIKFDVQEGKITLKYDMSVLNFTHEETTIKKM